MGGEGPLQNISPQVAQAEVLKITGRLADSSLRPQWLQKHKRRQQQIGGDPHLFCWGWSYQLQMGLSASKTPRPVSSKAIQIPNPRHTHWERSFRFHQGLLGKDLVSLLTVRCHGGLWQLLPLGQVTACRSKARLTFDKEPRTCSRSSVRALAISNSHYETTSFV